MLSSWYYIHSAFSLSAWTLNVWDNNACWWQIYRQHALDIFTAIKKINKFTLSFITVLLYNAEIFPCSLLPKQSPHVFGKEDSIVPQHCRIEIEIPFLTNKLSMMSYCKLMINNLHLVNCSLWVPKFHTLCRKIWIAYQLLQ